MTERCTIRTVERFGFNIIDEPSLPQACIDCIHKALDRGRAEVKVTDTKNQAQKVLKEVHGEYTNPDDEDQWNNTSMMYPYESPYRTAHLEYGYDLKTHSYEPESTHTVKEVIFICPND